MHNRSSALAFSLLCLGLATACSSSDRGAGGTLVVDEGADAAVLFPYLAGDETSRTVSDQIFDHLADIDDSLHTVGDAGFTPRLATKWDWAKDSMSIAFHLDPKARWHDGQPVRASDVQFSLQLAKDTTLPGSYTADVMRVVDSISMPDSLTAVAWFHKRSPEEFYDIVYQLPIVPRHIYSTVPAAQLPESPLVRNPVGSGRYRFVSWNAGSRIEIAADTANYHGRPKTDRIIFGILKSPQTAKAQVLNGSADVYPAFTPLEMPSLTSSATAMPKQFAQLGFSFLQMNYKDAHGKGPNPIFADVRVRRAISMAIDRQAILTNVFGSAGLLGVGPYPRHLTNADTTLHLIGFDVAHARALLDSAGWREASAGGVRVRDGRPLRFSMLVPGSSAPRHAYAPTIQEQLRAVGIQVDVAELDGHPFGDRWQGRDFDAALGSLVVDPSLAGLAALWGTNGTENFSNYTNPAVDKLLDSASSAYSLSARHAYLGRAAQMIVDDAPAVWLYDVQTIVGANRSVALAPLRADGWWAHLADWSVGAKHRGQVAQASGSR